MNPVLVTTSEGASPAVVIHKVQEAELHDLEGYWHQLTSRQTELFCNQYLSGIWPRERWGDFANLLTYLRLTLQVVM